MNWIRPEENIVILAFDLDISFISDHDVVQFIRIFINERLYQF